MYLLDANVFIDAARRYYHPDIAPTFSTWLKGEHQKGNLASIASVKKELDDGESKGEKGYLQQWAAELPVSFWLKPDENTAPSLSKLSSWVMHKDRLYTDAARREFLGIADYLLVAQAHSGKCLVVTSEQPAPNSKRKIKIPDACDDMNVGCLDPFELYRQLGLRFR